MATEDSGEEARAFSWPVELGCAAVDTTFDVTQGMVALVAEFAPTSPA